MLDSGIITGYETILYPLTVLDFSMFPAQKSKNISYALLLLFFLNQILTYQLELSAIIIMYLMIVPIEFNWLGSLCFDKIILWTNDWNLEFDIS